MTVSMEERDAVLRFEDRSLDLLLAEARATGKALLIELSAEWCAACKVFEDRVLPDPTVIDALRDVIWVRYDVEQPAGAEVAKVFSAQALPLFVVLDARGGTLGRFFGAPTDPGIFVEVVRQSAVLGRRANTPRAEEVGVPAAETGAPRASSARS